LGAFVEYSRTEPLRRAFDGTPEPVDFTEAFLVLERMIGQGGQPCSVSFIGGAIQVSDLFADHPGRFRRLTLRSAARGRWQRLLQLVSAPRFRANSFVPGLLTFLEKSCQIGIVGADQAALDLLGAELARHAPWHTFIAARPDRHTGRHMDLVIADGAGSLRSFQDARPSLRPQMGPVILAPAMFQRRGLGSAAAAKPHFLSQ
jgi:hypothetical protein